MPPNAGRASPEGKARNDQYPAKDTEPRSVSKLARQADQPQDQDDDDLAGQVIDLIVADARPLTPGQREALRRRILDGGPP